MFVDAFHLMQASLCCLPCHIRTHTYRRTVCVRSTTTVQYPPSQLLRFHFAIRQPMCALTAHTHCIYTHIDIMLLLRASYLGPRLETMLYAYKGKHDINALHVSIELLSKPVRVPICSEVRIQPL